MLLTCPHCTFQHPFVWTMNAHIDEKHATTRARIPFPSTILSVGPDGGGRAPTTISVPPIRSRGLQSGVGIEDSESEHGDTDEETVDDSEEQSNTEGEEEMDADNVDDNVDDNEANNNVANKDVANKEDSESDEENSEDNDEEEEEEDTFHLTYLIEDITSIHDYCIVLRKEYRKALKQLNDLDEYDKMKAIESYAKLEVKVKDDMFGIENEVEEKDDDFWDFVFEFRDKLEEDMKLLNNYVAVEKTKLILSKNIDEEEPMMDLKEIINNGINLMTDYHKHGEECFENCSNAQIHSVGGLIGYSNDPETLVKIRNYNPHKYDLIRKLTESNNKSLRKIGDPEVTVHEKRKTLQKTNVGESVFKIIKDLILPYMANMK